jgi:uncharacterized spore protein YtfJ
MAIRDLANGFTEGGTVKRVFGDPIERDGILVIPVASIRGAFGGGEGSPTGPSESPGPKPEASGWGGGGMWSATAAGAYVLKDGEVTWVPAVDRNRAILFGLLTGMFSLLVLRSMVRTWIKRR